MEEFDMKYSDDICDLFLKFKDINNGYCFDFLNNKNDNSYELLLFLFNNVSICNEDDIEITDEELINDEY